MPKACQFLISPFMMTAVFCLLAGVAPLLAAPIVVESVSICAQFNCDFDDANALLTGPLSIGTGSDTSLYSTLYSAQFCVAGSPGCPTAGGSVVTAPTLRTRFTSVDIACEGTENCSAFGIGFTFTGRLEGNYLFRFLLDDIIWTLPPGTNISGNMYMELAVNGVFLPVQFLSFDSNAGDSFGPTAPIRVSGRNTPFAAYGGLIVSGIPAGGRMQILHSGEFDFEDEQVAVPEPGAAALSAAGLALLALLHRRRRYRNAGAAA